MLMKDNSEERFPLVDETGQVIGSATRGECHNGSKLLHPVVHLHVFNSKGESSDDDKDKGDNINNRESNTGLIIVREMGYQRGWSSGLRGDA